jgi:hypothetical protein
LSVLEAPSISNVALELLVRSLVLPRTCVRVPGPEFSGPNGATITVRVRQPRIAQEQEAPGDPINYAPVNEVPVNVTLRHLYDATQLTDEDVTLSIEDFAQQVTAPQVAAIAIGAEDQVVAVMNALDTDVTVTDESDVEDAVLEARELLATNSAPLGGRWLAVSPQVATFMFRLDKFTRVDASGTASALRDAVIGRIYGFNVVESAGLTAGTALAYHESGILFANRAPVNPRGAANSSTSSEQGIALRQLFDFDVSHLTDVSAVSTFAGAAIVTEDGNTEENPGTDLRRVVKLGGVGSE